MIITRNTARLAAYARALQDYGIPCQVAGGAGLSEIGELRLLVLCLRCITRPHDPVDLVSVLRSELFGVSDDILYSFKKAGGVFSFHTDVPEELDESAYAILDDAFRRLRSYYLWLSRLPIVPALEIIVCDLGLAARACCQPGGDFMAGGIAKALELLRGGREMWSAEQAAEFLEALIQPDDRHDALSVFAREDCVRVMNIHKAKGLEAPVVFLADPYGAYKHDVVRHIDRSEDKVLGYLGILGEGNAYGRRGSLLAHPHGWDELAEREARFLEAEELRLRYVAATRSGNATIISQKATRNANNPWKCFDACTPSRWEPPQACEKPVAESPEHLDMAALRNATEDIELRLARCARPTYGAHAAKEYALTRSAPSSQPVQESLLLEEPQAEGRPGRDRELPRERGQAFGEAVHTVIEAAMKKADLELKKEVAARLAAKGIRLEYAPGAVAMLEEVIASSLWKRAVSSPKRLVEAPFFVMLEDEEQPTLLRGVIDLAFQEEGGWVLVDYKTDRVEDKSIEALADDYRPQMELYARAWEKCSGETVKELLVYFLDVGKVVKIR
jgi:ATP-dependent helicase/nuclease subunit A